ncbi:MAG: universal stress protein, partial [Pleurocapsa sp.]
SRQFKPIEKVLIAYDGSPTGQKMLQFIADSPIFQGLQLHLVTITKNKTETTAIARLDRAAQIIGSAGFELVSNLLEGHSERAIAEYITEQDISLLLMGAYGHSRIRHLVIGSTTAQILRSSHIPVLVFR